MAPITDDFHQEACKANREMKNYQNKTFGVSRVWLQKRVVSPNSVKLVEVTTLLTLMNDR